MKTNRPKLTKWDRELMAKTPRLVDLLEKGKLITTAEIDWDVPTGRGGDSINFVRVDLWNVVPTGFNGRFMCMQQQSKTFNRKVKVTVELI